MIRGRTKDRMDCGLRDANSPIKECVDLAFGCLSSKDGLADLNWAGIGGTDGRKKGKKRIPYHFWVLERGRT